MTFTPIRFSPRELKVTAGMVISEGPVISFYRSQQAEQPAHPADPAAFPPPTGDDMHQQTTLPAHAGLTASDIEAFTKHLRLQVGDAEKIKAALAAMPAERGTSPLAHAKALIEAFTLVNAAERLSLSSSGR